MVIKGTACCLYNLYTVVTTSRQLYHSWAVIPCLGSYTMAGQLYHQRVQGVSVHSTSHLYCNLIVVYLNYDAPCITLTAATVVNGAWDSQSVDWLIKHGEIYQAPKEKLRLQQASSAGWPLLGIWGGITAVIGITVRHHKCLGGGEGGGHRVPPDRWTYHLLGDLHVQISIPVHSKQCLKTICIL